MATRAFPFSLTVTNPGSTAPDNRVPFKTREDMQKGIDALVKRRTVGRIEPWAWDGATWQPDTQTLNRMALNGPAPEFKANFKAAAAMFSALAKQSTITRAESAELLDVVQAALNAAGIEVETPAPANPADFTAIMAGRDA